MNLMNFKQFLRVIRDSKVILTPSIWVLRSLKRIGVPISRNIYQHFPYRGLMTVDVPGGKPFKMISTGSLIENRIYWEGIESYEKGSMEIWMYLARRSSTVLDIGANSGIFSLIAWASGSKVVHAFEPIKRIYEHLKLNFSVNADETPTPWNIAISDQQGVLEIYDPGGDCPYSASLSKQFMDVHFDGYTSTKVAVINIDQFCYDSDVKEIDLIKLDVEGHELNALNGMLATILKSNPWILLEVLDGYEADLKHFFESKCTGKYRWCRVNENDDGPNRNVLLMPLVKCNVQLPLEISQHLFQQEILA